MNVKNLFGIFVQAAVFCAVACTGLGLVGTNRAEASDVSRVNPYSPAVGHPYRHGVVPTLDTLAKMKAWRAAHVAISNTSAPSTVTSSTLLSSSTVTYHGGSNGAAVTSGVPQVYLVFYGNQWGAANTDANGNTVFSFDPVDAAPYLQNLMKGIGQRELWSGVMTQYCDGANVTTGATACPNNAAHVGYPTNGALAGVWYDNSAPAPLSATFDQLSGEAVAAAIHFGNTTPASNRYSQYVIISPSGTFPDGFNQPGNGFCAWHSDAGYTPPGNGTLVNITYTNLPYVHDESSCGANFVNTTAQGALDGFSILEGHEYAETLTDQYPGSGWFGVNGLEGEVADECAWLTPLENGGHGAAQNVTMVTGAFAMQSTWSNDTNNCEISHPVISNSNYTSVYPHVYLRGTNNAWGLTPMALIANNVWSSTATFAAGGAFKFDINGDWTLNFGSGSKSGIAVQSGGNISTPSGANSYTITFNDSSKAYTVAISGAHLPLLAIAGPDQNIVSSTPVSVTLNGSASTDPNGTIVSYTWNELVNGVVTSVATGVNPTLANVSLGAHTYQLMITDNTGATATALVTVVVAAPAHVPPVANAGPNQNIVSGVPVSVTLNGSGSTDSDGTIVSYAWVELVNGVATPVATGATPTLTNVSVATHTYQLTVTDNAGATAAAQVTVTITAPVHVPPVANAGPNQTIVSSVPVSVTLNGSGSTDSDGTIVSYVWYEEINPTTWNQVATGVNPTLSNVSVGVHTYQLTVTDNAQTNGVAWVTVTVSGSAYTSVYKQMYLRGTNNAWATTAMHLVANNTWQTAATFGSGTQSFKFDVNGDWSLNFGAGSTAGIAVQGGGNIPVTAGSGSYTITFNDSTKAYTVTKP